MQNEPWVWPEVGDAGTSGAGAVPLKSAQLMGQQNNNNNNKKTTTKNPLSQWKVLYLSICSG